MPQNLIRECTHPCSTARKLINQLVLASQKGIKCGWLPCKRLLLDRKVHRILHIEFEVPSQRINFKAGPKRSHQFSSPRAYFGSLPQLNSNYLHVPNKIFNRKELIILLGWKEKTVLLFPRTVARHTVYSVATSWRTWMGKVCIRSADQ